MHMSQNVSHWKPGQMVGGFINRASRLLQRIGDSRLEPLGVVSGQLPVLALLKDGAELSQKELAQLVGIEQPTMAQTLARMERDGLVARRPHPEDKRSSLFSLTPLAVSKMPEIMELLKAGNEEALAGFTPEERALFLGLLKRFIENLEAAADKKPES